MCGEGTRTSRLGPCKPLVSIKGKAIIEHFLEGICHLVARGDEVIYIFREDHDKAYDLGRKVFLAHQRYLPDTRICTVTAEMKTEGPADTVRLSAKDLNQTNQIIIINHDQVIDFCLPPLLDNTNIYIPVSFDFTGKSSYVSISDDHRIVQIAEKQLISFYASAGVYVFPNKAMLQRALDMDYRATIKELKTSEIYVSHLVQNTIDSQGGCEVLPLEVYKKYDLGNCESIERFKSTLRSY